MLGKKKELNPIERHHKNQDANNTKAAIIFLGVVLLSKIFEDDVPASELNFEKKIYISILSIYLVFVIYSDINEFFKTRKVNSFLVSFICVAILFYNIVLG